MPGPTLTFGFIVATLLGAGFHLAVGGGARRLALFLAAGWIGFAAGHLVGLLFEINLLSIGATRFFPAAIGAGLALFFAYVLTKPQSSRSSRTS